MSSYPVSLYDYSFTFFVASVVRSSIAQAPHRPPVVSKLLCLLSSLSGPFCACYRISRFDNGSWSHYTVFKVLCSLPEAHFRAPLGDSLAIIPLRATNVKPFCKKILFLFSLRFFLCSYSFFRRFCQFPPVFCRYISSFCSELHRFAAVTSQFCQKAARQSS